jgi:hypothetical protein
VKNDTSQQVLNSVAVLPTATLNSVNNLTARVAGLQLSKAATLSANNTTASVNCFQLTGSVKVLKIYAILTAKTTLANCTAASFDLYDSTAVVQITQAEGVLSGLAVGTMVAKYDDNAVTWAINDNAAGKIMEHATNPELFHMFVATQKTAANTYIRFTYTTTDAPANAVLTVYVEYIPLGTSSTLVAV